MKTPARDSASLETRRSICRRAFDAARGLLQCHGTPALKRRLWDWEFRRGRWACLDETPDDPAHTYLTQYASGGRILDLGCGPCGASRYLDPATYASYVGVDISGVAVEQARRKNTRAQNSYVQSDFEDYRPDVPFDVILLGDSLYYLSVKDALGMLRRYQQHLSSGGVFIVKMHRTISNQPFFRLIDDHFQVVARHLHDQVTIVIFRVVLLAAAWWADVDAESLLALSGSPVLARWRRARARPTCGRPAEPHGGPA